MSAVKGGPLPAAIHGSQCERWPWATRRLKWECDAACSMLFSASGPPDSKPVVNIFCHCHASGKLNVSSFSCFTEFSALDAAAPHAGWPGLPARCRAAGNGVKTVTQEYRPSTGPSGSRTRRRGPSAGLERGQCAQPHQVWHIVGDIEGFGFDLLISRC